MEKLASFIKENRTGLKVISMVLVLALMIQTVSVAVTAISGSNLSIDEMVSIDEAVPIDNSLENIPSIVGEVESGRDRHTKVYELADGSFYEVVSNKPIHKNVGGQWEEPANNMDRPKSVEEVTSFCNELVESISEEQIDSGVSTLGLIVGEENSYPLNDTYVIGNDSFVLTSNQISKSNRLFIRIPDSLVSYANTNQVTINQSLNVEFSVLKTNDTGIMSAYGILEDWEISDAQKLTAYRQGTDDNKTYSYLPVGPNEIERQENVTDNFAFKKSDTNGYLDITELCIKWSKKLLDNNGVIIIPDDDSRATIVNCCLTRRYLIVDAYDTDFTYHSIDMGKAGQVLVNDFTNTITIQRNEMYYPAGKMPINLYRYFDFSKTYVDSNPAGSGSHWNYESPIKAETSERIAWSAFDGRTIRFEPSEEEVNVWHDKNGEGYTLNISATNISSENYDEVTIDAPDNITYTFGTEGKLKRIDDSNGNYILIKYNESEDSDSNETTEPNSITTQDYITSVENNSGYKYTFNYNDNKYFFNGSGINALESIEYQNDQNTTVKIEYDYTVLPNGTIALNKVTYPTSATEPDMSIEYLYDNTGRLVSIIDVDKRKLEISYKAYVPDYANQSEENCDIEKEVDNYPSVFSLKEYVFNKAYTTDMPEEEKYLQNSSLDIERHHTYQRTFTDMLNNTEIIHYNQELNLLYYINDNGNSYYVEYTASDDGQYVSQILSPENIENDMANGDFDDTENVDSDIEKKWFTDRYNSLIIENGEFNGTVSKYGTIEGSIGIERHAKKFAKIEGTAGDIIAVGCLAEANSAVPTDAHFFGIEIYGAVDWGGKDLESTDELLYRLAFDPTMDNTSQYKMGAFRLTDDYEYVEFRFVYSYQNGLAKFDNALVCNASEDNVTFLNPPTSDDNISDDSSSLSNENNNYNPNDILSDGVNQIGTLYDYSDETNNYLTEITDSNDVTTNFSYNQFTGFLSEKRVDMGDDSTDIIDKFSYNALGALTEVSRVVGYTENANDENTEIYNTAKYEYEYGKISSVVHNNMTYKFNYNSYGELEDIVVVTDGEDDITLISHDSTTNEDFTLNTITYSNGKVLGYKYDKNGRITSISDCSDSSSTDLYTYGYDNNGNISEIKDYVSCRIMGYSANSFEVHELLKNDGNESEGELLYSKSIDNGNEVYNVFSVGYTKTPNNPTYNNETKTTTYSSSTTANIGDSVKFDSYAACDYFGRIKNSSVIVSEQDVQNNEVLTIKHSIENETTYLNNAEGTLTTNLLGSYSSTIRSGPTETGEVLNEFTSEYSYDKAGRITHIYYKQNDNNRDLKYYYEYDVAGQLVKEADFIKMTYTEYTYNNFGNVTEKKIYSGANCFKYENNTIVVTADEPSKTVKFIYEENYGDVLTGYKVNGSETKYTTPDLYGNPGRYHRIDGDKIQTYQLEWEGNQLHTVRPADDDSLYEYKYDDEGRRTQKILYSDYNPIEPETKTVDMIMDYIWDNNKLMGYRIDFPSDTSVIIDAAILYDELDDPIGLRFCINGLTNGENDPDLSNEDIFWFIKDGQGNVVAIYSEKSNYTIGCNYTPDGKLEISNSNDFSEELNQKIEAANDFRKGLLIALSAILAIRASTMLSTDASQATYISAIMDEETGLYYCQNRYYSPEYGRYINVGNVEEIASDIYNPFDANPFVYYNNDPVNCKGTASSKKPATKVVGIQAELSKSLTSFTDSTGIELIYDSVKDELYAYYYQDANSYSNYNGMPRAIEMITDVFENISFSSNISLKNLALVLKMNNYVSLSYFNAETNKRFIWPTSYLGVAKVKPDDNNRYTVYGSGYQSKGICYYPVSNLGFGTKDMSVRYQKIELESDTLKDYLSNNKDNIIEAVK